ncbi:hypothetical protein G7Y79_00060g092020 [Physcia stellaris]|nr:hypothetical protein G7Y79_00060g092020 [Physcia stellaris]
MGFTEIFTDFCAAFSTPEICADAPPAEDEEKEEGGSEESKDDSEEGGEEAGGDEEGGEEGGERRKKKQKKQKKRRRSPRIQSRSLKPCAPLKHHFDECAERVQEQQENPAHKGPKEDCVEEFFHLQHCAAQCAAPKLFRILK